MSRDGDDAAGTHGGDDGGTPDERIGAGVFDEETGASSAVTHLYRSELHRMTRWRERLDRATRWSVVVIAAVLTWAFSSESNPH